MMDIVYRRPLRYAILGILWREGQLPLWRIERSVAVEYKPSARSTVSTTLTRMIEQGMIVRCERHYYRAIVTRQTLIDHIEQLAAGIIREIEEA